MTARFAAALLASLLWSAPSLAQERLREESVKAAFLYRFAGYVEWPAEALAGEHFTIAVLGPSDVAAELEGLLPGRSIKNLPARVRRIGRAAEIGDAHIVYVAPEYLGPLSSVAREVGTKPVLIVSDQSRGLDQGAIVNFVASDRRVRFEISIPAANRARLSIGAELLSVAARVRGARADAPYLLLPACGASEFACGYRVAAL